MFNRSSAGGSTDFDLTNAYDQGIRDDRPHQGDEEFRSRGQNRGRPDWQSNDFSPSDQGEGREEERSLTIDKREGDLSAVNAYAFGIFGEERPYDVSNASHGRHDQYGSADRRIDHAIDLDISEISQWNIKEIFAFGAEYGIDLSNITNKQHLIATVIRELLLSPKSTITSTGVLEILQDNGGFGFLRSPHDYMPTVNDVYVPTHMIRKYNFKTGQRIKCIVRQPNAKKGERYCSVGRVLSINEERIHGIDDLEALVDVCPFDELTACYPTEQYKLENSALEQSDNLTARIIDMLAPIGKGQRCVIVAPPRTGKTVLLKTIAHSISLNNPEAIIMVLLVDERPEEVTDMKKSVKGKVVSSTFDQSAERHIIATEMVLEESKRLVEAGKDVVILMDSLTRLARAYNTVAPSSGKVLTGGVDSGALQKPKRFFGAARNIEGGGSLTIIATALTETGSRMDEVIFEEFKGTGNSEIVLDRRVAEKRIFAAFDILKSGTRKEELLLSGKDMQRVLMLRRAINQLSVLEAIELLRTKLSLSKTNDEFLNSLGSIG